MTNHHGDFSVSQCKSFIKVLKENFPFKTSLEKVINWTIEKGQKWRNMINTALLDNTLGADDLRKLIDEFK